MTGALYNIPALSILLLMICGIVCFMLPGVTAGKLTGAAVLCAAAASAALMAGFLAGASPFTYSMGEIGAPFGNELRAGLLEAAAALVFCVVTLLSLMGGQGHLRHDVSLHKRNLYYVSLLFLLCSMLALVYTNDLFTAYVFVEINTISACGIIMCGDNSYTLAASIRYFIMSIIGSGLFLLSISIIYAVTGHLLLSNIQEQIALLSASGQYRVPLLAAAALMGTGLSLKSALWPFSSWLPDAHGSATASSSAMLSGLVLKSFIFLMIKLFCRAAGLAYMSAHPLLDLLLVFGCLGMIMGSVNALGEKDLKRMLAYSSVGQIGYIFCSIGLGTAAGMLAAVVQMLVHAVTKSMLFCSAGGFMAVSGESKKFSDLAGAGRRDRLAGAAFFVGTMSMIGIPMFAGFATKLTLVQAAVSAGGWRTVLASGAIIISTVLTAIYYLNVLSILFKRESKGEEMEAALSGETVSERTVAEAPEKPFAYRFAMVVFIALNLFIGLNADKITKIITDGLAMFG